MKPVRLNASFHEKVWGSTRLEPWFPRPASKIGEVWFEAGAPLPLLIKFIFTEEALSVQVHPDDAYAAEHENSRGKTEMWHILRADPGAKIAVGLRDSVSRERLREAALSGEIERLLNWIEVQPGDTFHIPAGTIHAIGGGLALCEIQQHSDVTYRLYDYGRPRELHLAQGLDVSLRERWHAQPAPQGALAGCPYYMTRLLDLSTAGVHASGLHGVLIVLEGSGEVNGEPFHAGEAWLTGGGPVEVIPNGHARLLETHVPE